MRVEVCPSLSLCSPPSDRPGTVQTTRLCGCPASCAHTKRKAFAFSGKERHTTPPELSFVPSPCPACCRVNRRPIICLHARSTLSAPEFCLVVTGCLVLPPSRFLTPEAPTPGHFHTGNDGSFTAWKCRRYPGVCARRGMRPWALPAGRPARPVCTALRMGNASRRISCSQHIYRFCCANKVG